jgi:hypothetical protein
LASSMASWGEFVLRYPLAANQQCSQPSFLVFLCEGAETVRTRLCLSCLLAPGFDRRRQHTPRSTSALGLAGLSGRVCVCRLSEGLSRSTQQSLVQQSRWGCRATRWPPSALCSRRQPTVSLPATQRSGQQLHRHTPRIASFSTVCPCWRLGCSCRNVTRA